MLSTYRGLGAVLWKLRLDCASTELMILKMNFNFNFKDMLRLPRQSIRDTQNHV